VIQVTKKHYDPTDKEIEDLKDLDGFMDIFIEVFRWFDIDLTDDAIGPGEVDPTRLTLDEHAWVAIGDIIMNKGGQSAALKWMSAGPSGRVT